MDNQQQDPTEQDRELCSAWMGGEFEGEWIHVYAWLNRSAVHLKLTTLLIVYKRI